MKFYSILLFIMLGLLLSGCAYIEGRKDQAASSHVAITKKSTVIQQQKEKIPSPSPSRSEITSKALTPVTH